MASVSTDLPPLHGMTTELFPLPLPISADASKLVDFGREVKGVDPGSLNQKEFEEIRKTLYKVCLYFYSSYDSRDDFHGSSNGQLTVA
jgi:hypothetical protein